MRIFPILALVALAPVCAAQLPDTPTENEQIAVCYSKPQCDAIWSEAIVQMQAISGMRLETVTDLYIQTFKSKDSYHLSAWARKTPRPNGSTFIDAEFVCNYCNNYPFTELDRFITAVKQAGQGFAVPNLSGPKATPTTPTVTFEDYQKAFSAPAK